jgi:hypothetical protein
MGYSFHLLFSFRRLSVKILYSNLRMGLSILMVKSYKGRKGMLTNQINYDWSKFDPHLSIYKQLINILKNTYY